MASRLENASSAYLRSAAHQPIDWYEFGEEAFEKARLEDKPVLLDIGAVWCHWCHVIDRESYDDPEIAAIINEHYIAVKVDRDQRPDVDSRYQQVVQALSGQGGWPLTGFLTYDGRLIYGGTYFPPQTMKNLLLRIKDVYKDQRADIFENPLPELIEAEEAPPHKALDDTLIQNLIHTAQRMFDPVDGGFGVQPKFPHFSGLSFLIQKLACDSDPNLAHLVNLTLTKMGLGGIYDQLAGGFHRYSVDRRWHVPHFEKMAYDNGEALSVYAYAYRLTNLGFYRDIAEGIINWVNADLSDQLKGGFYATQDADIDLNDDGDFFTWTLEEVKQTLPDVQAEAVIRYYSLTQGGDMHERPGRNVLMIHENPQQFAAIQTEVDQAKPRLLAQRLQRCVPFIDKSLFTNWNGMLICGYLDAADLLGLESARAFALKSMDRLWAEYFIPGNGLQHTAGIEGFLDDQAWFLLALLKGYQSTGVSHYLDQAIVLADLTLERFQDDSAGGFYDIPKQTDAKGLLRYPKKPVEDTPSGSANGILIQGLLILATLTENQRYREAAEKALRYFADKNAQYGIYVAALATALDWYLNPPLKIELVSPTPEWIAHARAVFAPGKIIKHVPDAGEPEARLCIGTHCLPPVQQPEQLDKALAVIRV